VQVHRLAERYRQANTACDPENVPEAFREGPLPELFQAPDRAGLLELLVQRARLFVEILGYELQNIGILVPFNEDAAFIRERLAPLDLPLANIKDPEFSFEAAGSIRVSTLHSAKGLDFPVVLLFLDRPPYFGSGYDEESLERMTANIVYVAMTRAMDHLNVFTLEKPESQAIANLVGVFGEEAQGE
jgi:superfamily I DNA/RNA helicase